MKQKSSLFIYDYHNNSTNHRVSNRNIENEIKELEEYKKHNDIKILSLWKDSTTNKTLH